MFYIRLKIKKLNRIQIKKPHFTTFFFFFSLIFLATLSTTKQSRKLKSRSLPPSSRVHSAPPLINTTGSISSSAASSLPLSKKDLTLPLNSRLNFKPHMTIETINEINAKHIPNYLKKTKASALKGSAAMQQRKNLEDRQKMAAESK